MNEFEKQSLQPRRHNIQPSCDFSAQFRDDSPQLAEKLPLKIMNVSRHPLQKPSQYYPQSHFKENIPEPSQGMPQKEGSHVLVKDNFQYDERNQQERQRSEKSYTDFSRSLANLGRVNESVSILEESSIRRSRPQTIISHGGSKLPGSQFQSLSSTANKFPLNLSSHKDLHNSSKTSTIKEYDNPYFQSQERNTPDFEESIRKDYWQEHKSLHTEGNSPLAKEHFLQKRASGNFARQRGENRRDEQHLQKPSLDSFRKRGAPANPVPRKENHRNLTAYEADLRKRNIGLYEPGFSNFNHSFKTSAKVSHNRTVTSKESTFSKQKRVSQEGMRLNNKSYQSHKTLRNHDPLDQYTLSEDVKYGNGGVGYSMGTEADFVAGGDSKRSTSGEKRNKSDVGRVLEKKVQTTVRGSRAVPADKNTQSSWKQEILEIRQDIERRKKSYDRVNKFVKMCDKDEEFGERQGSSYDHHSQQTQPTLQTLPTQFERSASPVIAPAVNIFGFAKPVDKKGVKQRKESSIDRQQQRWMQASARNLTEIKMIDLDVDDEPRTVSRDEEALLRMKAVPLYQTHPRPVCEVTAGSFVNGNACSKCFRSPCCCCGTNTNYCQIF